MSKLSFKTFCIELYAEHIGKDSTDVYALFCTSGLLDLLEKDYDDLHGMSMEYLMQYFDEYLKHSISSLPNQNIFHSMYNATIIPEIVKLISDKYYLSEQDAMDVFYKSNMAKALNDPETGLYGHSALFIFSQFVMEKCEIKSK